MAGVAWPFNETGTTGAPAVTARQLRQQQSAFVAMGTTARPLGAKSGIRVGTPSSVVSITGSGPYTWNAGGFGGVIDGEANAAAGPYTYSFETAQTGPIAASGGAARQDRLDVQISDSDEGDGSGTKTVQIIYTQGAATGGAVPAAPPRSHALGVINVPTSDAPTFSWAPEWCGDPGEWTFNTVAERDAYVLLIGASNVPLNQRATVISDTTAANNGDYVWSGSGWIYSNAGVVPLTPGGVAFTAASAVSIDQKFGTSFANYLAKITIRAASASSVLQMRMRAAGVDASGSGDYSGSILQYDSSAGGAQTGAVSYAQLNNVNSAGGSSMDVEFKDPASANPTLITSTWSHRETASAIATGVNGSAHQLSTAYDGFTIFPSSGTVTGVLFLYGLV